MSDRDQLTYYEGGLLGRPTQPSEQTSALLVQAHKLDSFLGSQIRESDTEGLLLSRLDFRLGENNQTDIKDTDTYLHIVQSVCDWTEMTMKSIGMTDEQRSVLRAGLFENDLGRAGLSINVDICSLLVCEKLGIKPLHFAQGSMIPQTVEEVPVFKERLTYIRDYTTDKGIPEPVSSETKSPAYVRCSYAKMSIALIEKMEQILESLDLSNLKSRLKISSSSFEEKAQISNVLSEGINDPTGIIYSLSNSISS